MKVYSFQRIPELQEILIFVHEHHALSAPVHQNWQQGSQLQPTIGLSLAAANLISATKIKEFKNSNESSRVFIGPALFFSLPQVP